MKLFFSLVTKQLQNLLHSKIMSVTKVISGFIILYYYNKGE